MEFRLIIDKDAKEEIVAIVNEPSSLTEQIENLVKGFSGTDSVIGYRDDEMRKLPFGKIECFTVVKKKVIAVSVDGKQYRIQDRLRNLELKLPNYFIRINKSAIANELEISRFSAAFNGGVDAVFQSGYREYVSRRCFSEIKRRYGEK